MGANAAVPTEYTQFQKDVFDDCLLPVLECIRKAASGKGRMRDGILVDGLPLTKSDWWRLTYIAEFIVDYAREEFDMCIADTLSMSEVGLKTDKYEGRMYCLIDAEEEALLS